MNTQQKLRTEFLHHLTAGLPVDAAMFETIQSVEAAGQAAGWDRATIDTARIATLSLLLADVAAVAGRVAA